MWSWRKRRRPKRTAFVLAGGGNRGALQVGMLRALLDAGVTPDLLVGASVGAINAAAFAADPTVAGIERLARTWRGVDDETLFPHHHYGGWRFIQHRDSVYPSAGLRNLIVQFLPYERLEDAAVPVEVVATSIVTGTERWFSTGTAVEALMASGAIPGVFPPVRIGEDILIDGGVLDDVPITRAFELGADRVFTLLCGPPFPAHTEMKRPVDALLVAFDIAVRGRFLRERETVVPDGKELFVIGSDLPHLAGYWDFSRTEELMAAGERAAREVLSEAASGGGR